MDTAPFATPDLCDAHPEVLVCELPWRPYGGRAWCRGPVVTVRCHEDNSRVRELLRSPGEGRVLVVDGGGSLRCALVGDLLGAAGVENGWAGVIVNGAVRDTPILATLPIAVFALGTHPRKSNQRGDGEVGVPVHFGGVTVTPGDYLYADGDGVVLATREL